MRPARMPSAHVKVRPWYYTERNQPTRAADNTVAIIDNIKANEPHDCTLGRCDVDS